MKHFGMVVTALTVAVIAFALVVGCSSIAKPLEARLHAKLMPADKQAATTELALDAEQVKKLEANVAQLDALKAAMPKLDNKYTAQAISEANASIAWYQERITQINAILPTLPERAVATPPLETAPPPAPAAAPLSAPLAK